MYPINILEEELKNKVAQDFFGTEISQTDSAQIRKTRVSKNAKGTRRKALLFDTTQILGEIDFCVSFQADTLFRSIHFLWAEAKKGNKANIIESFIQLILTIGKNRTFSQELPPLFLGAFDCEKIAFIPYIKVAHIFNQNDFNWNVTPSNHDTKEFKQLYALSKDLLESEKLEFRFKEDHKNLKEFISQNFTLGNTSLQKLQVDKNNFMAVYQHWFLEVKDSISIDWDLAKQSGILDADFFLADLLSDEDKTLKDKLFVILNHNYYELMREKDSFGFLVSRTTNFNDNQKAHKAFWNLYERPPKEEYWDYIIERRDLLVPSDVRERKGAFFTPRRWVRKAQEYLSRALGEDWQSEYYIWDCAAGTGNLLANLTEGRNIYASTLDRADVDIMQDLAQSKSLALLKNHIFQFDFLNDPLFDKPCDKHKNEGINPQCQVCIQSKLPESLQKILSDEKERKKLVIFINPPYAEATSATQVTGTGKNKDRVSLDNAIYEKYKNSMGKASNELFTQFFFRIYKEIPNCTLASFSKLKYVNSSNFKKFRESFQAKFLKGFIVPASTFDNVRGKFPIGFLIWDLSQKIDFKPIKVDVFSQNSTSLGTKKIHIPTKSKNNNDKQSSINHWVKRFDDKNNKNIFGYLENPTPDFQNNKFLCTLNHKGTRHNNYYAINESNLFIGCIYFSVRHCIDSTWLNDRDQFLYPKDSWWSDFEFHADCLAFMLFHGQNRITSKEGVNHFIPFKESEIEAQEAFKSDFMYKFIQGKIKLDSKDNPLFNTQDLTPTKPIKWSNEAKNVFDAGRKLWKHYHTQARDSKDYLINASLYDIKAYFQGFDAKGKMNSPYKAEDETYKNLLGALNYELKLLGKKFEPKIYEHGFLMK